MRKSTKILGALGASAVVLSTAGIAYAYWSTSGSGDGTATTAAAAGLVVVHQTSTVSNLSPGSGTQALSGNFDNTTNPSAVKITQVSVDFTGTVWQTNCSSADYALVQPAAQTAANNMVPVGTGTGSWTGGSIEMLNATGNQDGCKGQALKLHYTAA
ncbi:MAG: hypothetical protein JWL77_7016 [Chthonomonadaceae bacterium]|nr:hypothetical protein [Chthonomonadaceae bacterium]